MDDARFQPEQLEGWSCRHRGRENRGILPASCRFARSWDGENHEHGSGYVKFTSPNPGSSSKQLPKGRLFKKPKTRTSPGLLSSSVVKNLPVNAGDTDSIPGLGRFQCHRATEPASRNY